MDAYASIYPGIDLLPTRLPHVDRHGHAWCVACHGRNGRAVAGDGLCDTCRGFNHCKPEHRRIAYGHELTNLGGVISTTRKRLTELEKPDRGRWLEARYPGECRSCHEPIGKGDRALYFKRSRELECQPCGLGDGGTGA
jgi:hypothetical protein